MSILSRIKDAIIHGKHDSRPLTPPASERAPTPAKSASASVGIPANPANAAWDRRETWLHKCVMQELEKNGGKVPASLVA